MLTSLIDPIAFSLGPLTVRWYGIILGTAALVGLLLAIQEGKRFGIKPDFFMDMLLLGVPSAVICARIYYVAFKWEDYKANPLDVFKIWEGGIAIYGALIGAFLCGFFYFRYKGYSFLRLADVCVPGLLAGQMIGRWGNFMNQEAYGGPVEESFLRDTLHLPNFIVNQMNVNGIFHHPAFLYESLWSLVGIIVLCVLRRQRFLRAGELLASYFIWYSLGRFYIEMVRTDSLAFHGPEWLVKLVDVLWSPMTILFQPGYLDPAYGNLRISQLLALLLIVGAIAFIVIRRKTGAAKEHYSDPIVSTKVEHAVMATDDVPKA
ncbi:phosphatidylglycerol:prolipoprotein diacylglycerol transferase [Paenibacillus algorifonticola]|uniref:Phosphatidylglycerol--prolipoprotein diacylglyceryl transferase n=1 Tax=Paenibacillus algorifonticola TaxID=684063 RepID=A0A1I2I0B6_9BACL|nr:prolipoprotein diacylglyceryl transferase [Paenibacillus algorifonticola]SFF35063.1 phosphatidylglycerol:prolipoprotein diacylglycerol transferase [Paenibacillus algorifonticola]